jgi:hypothetical protein
MKSKNGKEPFPGSRGLKDSSSDEEVVRQMWREHPDANIGLALEASGLVALDVDGYVDPAALAEFRATHELPETYTQSTPSGGFHYIYRTEDGQAFPGKIAGLPGEVKHKGYVVLAPSIAVPKNVEQDPMPYVVLDDREPVKAPQWLVEAGRAEQFSGRDREIARSLRTSGAPDRGLIELLQTKKNSLDDYDDWLATLHGVHFEYAGTDLEPRALEAFIEWCVRWEGAGRETRHTDEVLRREAEYKWRMAHRDHENPVRGATARMHLEKMPLAEPVNGYGLSPHRSIPLHQHPPLPWLLGRHYLGGAVSVTVAPGGTGKSLLAIHEALSLATGRSLLGEQVYGPRRVLYMNGGEDGASVISARVDAAMHFHGLTDADLGGRLFTITAPELAARLGVRDFKLATDGRAEGFKRNDALADTLIKYLLANQVDVLILDPLKHFHLVPENDNDLVNELAMLFVRIAEEADCAVELVHHASKDARERSRSIGIAQARGAGALVDKARTARYLAPMTKDMAEKLGIDDANGHVEAIGGKSNYGPTSGTGRWFKIEGLELGNGTREYPDGDTVGVLSRIDVRNSQPQEPDIGEYLALLQALLVVGAGARLHEQSPSWIWLRACERLWTGCWRGNHVPRSDEQPGLQPKADQEVHHGCEAGRTASIRRRKAAQWQGDRGRFREPRCR